MMGYGLYVQHSMGDRGRVRRKKAKMAAAAAAKEKSGEDCTTSQGLEKEIEDGSELLCAKDRLKKYNAEWKRHYGMMQKAPEMNPKRKQSQTDPKCFETPSLSNYTARSTSSDIVRTVLLGSSPTSVLAASIIEPPTSSRARIVSPEETFSTTDVEAETSIMSSGSFGGKTCHTMCNNKRTVVKFGHVEVREYSVVIGSHPWCVEGLALSLGWYYSKPQLYTVNFHQENVIPAHRRRRVNGHSAMYLEHQKEQEQSQQEEKTGPSIKRRSSSLSWLSFLSSSITSLESLDENLESKVSCEQASPNFSDPYDNVSYEDYGIFEDVAEETEDNFSSEEAINNADIKARWFSKLSNDRRPSCDYRLTYDERLQLLQLLSKHHLAEHELRRIERDQELLCEKPEVSVRETSERNELSSANIPTQRCCSPLLQRRKRKGSLNSRGSGAKALLAGTHSVGGGIRRSRRYRSCGRLTSRI